MSPRLPDLWPHRRAGEVVLLDNRDSFVYNLAHRFFEVGERVAVIRSDEITVDELASWKPAALVLSPGPGHPRDAGVCVDAVQRLAAEVPILGVCLGHQAIGMAFGGNVVESGHPVHGKPGEVEHDGGTLFEGIATPFVAGRYHSLVVELPLPDVLEVTARCSETVMAIEHRHLPVYGVQFHPESVLTGVGQRILENFLAQIPARPPDVKSRR